MEKWFVINKERVSGPFREDEIKAQLASGTLLESELVWGRPLEQWIKLSKWSSQVSQMTASVESINTQQMWHYAVDGDSKGPMTRTELVNELKQLRNKNDLLVWTKGMKAWADLYDFHDLLDEVGLNRREHPRCHIDGSVVIKFENQTLIGQLCAISAGGLGANQINANLPIGQSVQVEIKAAVLGDVIMAKATLQYISEGGYAGFKFTNLSMEAKSKIMGYIKSIKTEEKSAA